MQKYIETPMVCLKLVCINGKAVIEFWNTSWTERKDQVWMDGPEQARQWAKQSGATLVWDLLDEEVEVSRPQIISEAVVGNVPAEPVTVEDLLDHSPAMYAATIEGVKQLRWYIHVNDMVGARDFANKELHRVRRWEEGDSKTEYKNLLNDFKKFCKKGVA